MASNIDVIFQISDSEQRCVSNGCRKKSGREAVASANGFTAKVRCCSRPGCQRFAATLAREGVSKPLPEHRLVFSRKQQGEA